MLFALLNSVSCSEILVSRAHLMTRIQKSKRLKLNELCSLKMICMFAWIFVIHDAMLITCIQEHVLDGMVIESTEHRALVSVFLQFFFI